MHYILDLAVILIILFFIITSAKRGFVRVLLEVLGFIAAIALTFTISTPLSKLTYDKIIEPSILEVVEQKSEENIDTLTNSVWEALPEFVKINSERLDLNPENFSNSVSNNIYTGTETALKSSLSELIEPIAVKVLSLCYSTIIFGILFFAVKFLAKWVNKLFSFSLVGKVNKVLGGAVGIIKGVIVVAFFFSLIYTVLSFTKNGFWIFTQENVMNSYFFRFFTGIIPFNII